MLSVPARYIVFLRVVSCSCALYRVPARYIVILRVVSCSCVMLILSYFRFGRQLTVVSSLDHEMQ